MRGFLTSKMTIEINNITKMSFNEYNHLHWTKKKKFKDNLRLLIKQKAIKGNYNLDFKFYFVGRKLDRVNVFHYAKIIEDKLFPQDKDNGWIKVNTFKSNENKCVLKLINIDETE